MRGFYSVDLAASRMVVSRIKGFNEILEWRFDELNDI